jgi:hypothetical protein
MLQIQRGVEVKHVIRVCKERGCLCYVVVVVVVVVVAVVVVVVVQKMTTCGNVFHISFSEDFHL